MERAYIKYKSGSERYNSYDFETYDNGFRMAFSNGLTASVQVGNHGISYDLGLAEVAAFWVDKGDYEHNYPDYRIPVNLARLPMFKDKLFNPTSVYGLITLDEVAEFLYEVSKLKKEEL